MPQPQPFRRGRRAAPAPSDPRPQVLRPVRPAPPLLRARRGAAILAGLPLLALAATVFSPFLAAAPLFAQEALSGVQRRELFPLCAGGRRVTCVVDGDTLWLRGAKIRIADIDTPEVSQPACPRERALGLRATERMRELLNAGAFRVEAPADGRTRDRFGRELRIITRGGQSLGAVLVREGLAVRWGGPRREWC